MKICFLQKENTAQENKWISGDKLAHSFSIAHQMSVEVMAIGRMVMTISVIRRFEHRKVVELGQNGGLMELMVESETAAESAEVLDVRPATAAADC